MFIRIVKTFLLFLGSIIHHNRKSKILYYHDIYLHHSYSSLDSDILMGTSLKMFQKHLDVIRKEGYSIVSKISGPEGEVAVMFDDGYRGVWDNRQFFYDNNICPTVFLAVDLIGRDGFLSINEILELQRHGFIFQCHGWSHIDLTTIPAERLSKELVRSKEYLSGLLHKTVSEICLPIGSFSDYVIGRCVEAGYKEIYSSISGDYDDLILNILRCRNLCQFSSPAEVKFILRGGNSIFRKRLLALHYINTQNA